MKSSKLYRDARYGQRTRREEWSAIVGFVAVSGLLASLYVTLTDMISFDIGSIACIVLAIITIVAFHIEGES